MRESGLERRVCAVREQIAEKAMLERELRQSKVGVDEGATDRAEPSRGVSHPLSWSGNDAQSRIDHGLSQMDERSAEGPDRC